LAALALAALVGTARSEVIYYQFDDNGTPLDERGGIDLIRVTTGQSALFATINNPDPGPFDDGSNPATNAGSVYQPAFRRGSSTGGTNRFRMVNRSWTFEGYFRRDPAGSEPALNSGWGEIIANTRNWNRNWDDGWTLKMNSDGRLQYRAEDGNTALHYTSTGTYADGDWHHFAITWEHGTVDNPNGTMQLYVDNIFENGGHGVGNGVDGANVFFTIGYRNLNASPTEQNRFMGRLDEFRWTYDEILEPWQFLNGSGEPPVVEALLIPEPAGLGLVGLALAALRRKRK
jgi:hypothetical protein